MSECGAKIRNRSGIEVRVAGLKPKSSSEPKSGQGEVFQAGQEHGKALCCLGSLLRFALGL